MKLKALELSTVLLLASLFCLLLRNVAGQQEYQEEKSKYGLKPSDYALPPGAIELKVERRFPTENDRSGMFLSQPQGFCAGSPCSLYVSDARNGEVYLFDCSGEHKQTIGRFGQGPGEFAIPKEVAFADNRLFVRDIGNRRIQIFNHLGVFENSFKLFKDYYSLCEINGLLYTAPVLYVTPGDNRDRFLIDVLDFRGKLIRSFGAALPVNQYDNSILNRVRVAPAGQNELWVSFDCFPIVRKYSLEGGLIAEYRYSYGIADKKSTFNKRMGAQRTKSAQVPYYDVNSALFPVAEGVYLLGSSDKRIDILLMDNSGRLAKFYWLPIDKSFACFGLFVSSESPGPKFYALDTLSACIEVYSIK